MAYRELQPDTFLKNKAVADARRTGGDYQGTWKPVISKAGTEPARNRIRIMPPHEQMDDVIVESKMHFLPSKEIGTNGRPIAIGIVCATMYDEECPACLAVDKLYKEAKTADDEDEAKKLKDKAYDMGKKTRLFANVVDMAHPEKGVQLYAFGPDVEKKLRACFIDDDGEFRNITHPKTGRDVFLHATTKQGTTFPEYPTVRCAEKDSALKDMKWLDEIVDLTVHTKQTPRKQIELALKGERPPRDGDAKTAAKTETAKKKPAPEPEEEPEEEEPAPKAVKKKAVEEEAPPAKKSKRAPVVEEEESAADPFEAARKECAEAGFDTPPEITVDEVSKIKKPPCYTKETDPTDELCQTCKVLLPCLTAKMAAESD